MNRKMKDSGIEWIGEIPNDYKMVAVKRLFIIGRGRVIAQTELENDGVYPVYSSQTKNNGCMGYINTYDFDKPQLTWTTDGANAGTVFYREGKYNCTNVCGTLLPKTSEHNIRYLKYCLEYIAIYHKRADINGFKIMNNEMAEIMILIPPAVDQQRIADYLDQKCAEIDSIIENTKASIEEYKAYKQSVITEAVTKGLNPNAPMIDSGVEWIGEMPGHWKVIRVKNLLNESKARSIEGNEEPLSMSQQLGVVKSYELDIPNATSSYIGGKLVYKGFLVFNKLKAHLGVFAVSLHDGVVSPDYAVYVGQAGTNVKFLEYLFKTKNCIQEFKKHIRGVGAGLSRLYTSDLFGLKIAIPNYDEQVVITKYIDQKCTEIDNLISQKQLILSELETYKKSLIYEYVTGKKEV